MNTDETIKQLTTLQLHGMAEAYKALLHLPLHDRPTLDQFVAHMTQTEHQWRTEAKMRLYIKQSKLRYNAVLEDVHYGMERNLTKEMVLSISDCSFIKRAENLLITGSTGVGKSFIACAIGRQACAMGYKTNYLSMSRFLEKVSQSKIDGSFVKLLNKLEKVDLIILDDFGMHPMDVQTRLALLQILEDRYDRKATIIASQLPISCWYDYIGEATVADAILDRLTGKAHRFELKGKSRRKKQ